jgi:nitrogen fixation protein FixH
MTMTAMPSSDRIRPAASGRWIPWLFAGLFLVVLAVNGTMIAIAVSTFNGLETTQAYEKGLAYNDNLAAAAEQQDLGWQASLDVSSGSAGRVTLTFDLADRLGAAITGADVHADLDRPLQAGHEQTATLDEVGVGRYAATVELPLMGQWDVQLIAAARGHRHQLAKRIHVTP